MISHYIERDEGFMTHYLEWEAAAGDSLPVICIHGNLTNAGMYRWIGENISAGDLGPARNVIAIDMRGCGGSSLPPAGYTMQHFASDIEAVMRDAGIEKAHFIAFSRGVHYALQFALDHPGSVAGFVSGDYPPVGKALTEKWVESVMEAYIESETWEDVITRLSPDGTLTRQTAEAIADVMFRERDGVIRKHYPKELPQLMQRESTDIDLTAGLDHITGPVLVIKGSGPESQLSDEQARVYATVHTAVQVETVSGTGHDVFYPNSQTADLLRQFFSQVS